MKKDLIPQNRENLKTYMHMINVITPKLKFFQSFIPQKNITNDTFF